MSIFEKIMDMLPENFSIDDIAEKAGMTVDEAKKGGEALFAKLRDGSMDKMTAIKEAAAEAGLDGEGSLMEKLTGEDGLLGKVTGFFDRDGDGNPINDLANKAKGFFKK